MNTVVSNGDRGRFGASTCARADGAGVSDAAVVEGKRGGAASGEEESDRSRAMGGETR